MSEFQHWLGRAKVTGEIGEGLAGDVKKAEAHVERLGGGRDALKKASGEVVRQLHDRIDKDYPEDGAALAELDAIALKQKLKNYVTAAGELLTSMGDAATKDGVTAHGRLQGLREALEVVQRYHTGAVSRSQQIVDTAALRERGEDGTDDDGARKPRGGRPSAAERRAATETEASTPAAPEEPQEAPQAQATKKRGTKKRPTKKPATKKPARKRE